MCWSVRDYIPVAFLCSALVKTLFRLLEIVDEVFEAVDGGPVIEVISLVAAQCADLICRFSLSRGSSRRVSLAVTSAHAADIECVESASCNGWGGLNARELRLKADVTTHLVINGTDRIGQVKCVE